MLGYVFVMLIFFILGVATLGFVKTCQVFIFIAICLLIVFIIDRLIEYMDFIDARRKANILLTAQQLFIAKQLAPDSYFSMHNGFVWRRYLEQGDDIYIGFKNYIEYLKWCKISNIEKEKLAKERSQQLTDDFINLLIKDKDKYMNKKY